MADERISGGFGERDVENNLRRYETEEDEVRTEIAEGAAEAVPEFRDMAEDGDLTPVVLPTRETDTPTEGAYPSVEDAVAEPDNRQIGHIALPPSAAREPDPEYWYKLDL